MFKGCGFRFNIFRLHFRRIDKRLWNEDYFRLHFRRVYKRLWNEDLIQRTRGASFLTIWENLLNI